MTKIICPCDECSHNSGEYVCLCEEVNLKACNVVTSNQGRQDYWTCKNYEKSKELQELDDKLNAYFRGIKNEKN